MNEKCVNCGAPREPRQPCRYCHDGSSVFSLGQMASAAKQDNNTFKSFLPQLSSQLEEALPGQVTVRRTSSGLLHKSTNITELRATVGQEEFVVIQKGQNFKAEVQKVVKGIVLKREEVTTSEWLEHLSRSLGTYSMQMGEVPASLHQFLKT